jgi:hypothetical protein
VALVQGSAQRFVQGLNSVSSRHWSLTPASIEVSGDRRSLGRMRVSALLIWLPATLALCIVPPILSTKRRDTR